MALSAISELSVTLYVTKNVTVAFYLRRKCCCGFHIHFCDTEFWNLSGILSSLSVDYMCFLRRLTQVFRASSPVTSTPWKAPLLGWVFVYDFFSILSFHNPVRRLFAGDQGHPLLIYNIYLFSRHSCFL